jgi:hypothetical protein
VGGGGKKCVGVCVWEGGCSRSAGLRPLIEAGPAVVSKGGRSATVGQPPFGTTVSLLPPLAPAVGAKLLCRVADQPPLSAAVGLYRRLKQRQEPNRHGKQRFEAICANVESDYLFS